MTEGSISRRALFSRLGLAAVGLMAARPFAARSGEATSVERAADLTCQIELEQSTEGIEVDLYLTNHSAEAVEVMHKRSGRVASMPRLEVALSSERFELQARGFDERKPMPRVIRIRHLTLPSGVAVHYGHFTYPWPEAWRESDAVYSGQKGTARAHFDAHLQNIEREERALLSGAIALTVPEWSTAG